MKINHPITDTEQTYGEDAELVSTTNLKGAITYANQAFIDISGFSSEELLKKNHNVLRHPDVPEAARMAPLQAMAVRRSPLQIPKPIMVSCTLPNRINAPLAVLRSI